jgi:hypothetical protein
MLRKPMMALVATGLGLASPLYAQTEAETPPAETTAEGAEAALLTDAELQTLVAPVALYPDTLLIQVLVASTVPLEVIKSDRFLTANPDTPPEALKDDIDAQGWDPSVAVLATAFPTVIADMAEHIEWTETMGTAMLAQDEAVLSAVQVMRQQAIETGALISGEAQTVEVDEETVVIQPTDPDVVYVPQYVPAEVYGGPDATDILIGGAIGFGTFALIDAIFDDDDDWNGYWGCRNCGGWGGQPIIRNPNIDLDMDGNVNIGNVVGNGGLGGGDGWRPDPDRAEGARDKIANRRDDTGATKLPVRKPESGGTDALRDRLSERSGAADIARPGATAALGAGAAAGVGSAVLNRDRPAAGGRDLSAARPGARDGAQADRNGTLHKPATAKRPAIKKASGTKHTAFQKRSGGGKAKLASKRGGGAAKKKFKR